MIGNKVTPTSTATPARVRLFQPTQRPVMTKGEWIETTWGMCRVSGRLGQRHADLLEIMLYVAQGKRELQDKAVELLVDPAAVRRCLSDAGHSGGRINAWLEELMSAIIEIRTSDLHVLGHLIDHVQNTEMTLANPLGGQRNLWTVRLGLPLAELLRNDVHRYYDPSPLARLTYGISQAVARHILSHQYQPTGGWLMDGLIKTVSGKDITKQALRDRRRELRADARILALIDILIEENRVRVEQRPGNVEQRPGSVEQRPGSVEQRPGAWSNGPGVAGISGYSGCAAQPRT